MLHGAQHFSPSDSATLPTMEALDQARRPRRKRKAETQDNERLSKRLSLLNLGMLFSPSYPGALEAYHHALAEQNGSKLYVPVEAPSANATATATATTATTTTTATNTADDSMQLDDSKHKVYIYNIDDELSSDSEGEEGRLVFLPDIEKHLKANRIPPSILANSDGELAGMQLVLYNDPKSLSVPEDKDSVRKAIIESRHRLREQQRLERDGLSIHDATITTTCNDADIAEAEIPTDADPDAMDMD